MGAVLRFLLLPGSLVRQHIIGRLAPRRRIHRFHACGRPWQEAHPQIETEGAFVFGGPFPVGVFVLVLSDICHRGACPKLKRSLTLDALENHVRDAARHADRQLVCPVAVAHIDVKFGIVVDDDAGGFRWVVSLQRVHAMQTHRHDRCVGLRKIVDHETFRIDSSAWLVCKDVHIALIPQS